MFYIIKQAFGQLRHRAWDRVLLPKVFLWCSWCQFLFHLTQILKLDDGQQETSRRDGEKPPIKETMPRDNFVTWTCSGTRVPKLPKVTEKVANSELHPSNVALWMKLLAHWDIVLPPKWSSLVKDGMGFKHVCKNLNRLWPRGPPDLCIRTCLHII